MLQMLDEIQAGIFDGWTYEQIEQQMPQEYAARKKDKLKYRCGGFIGKPLSDLQSVPQHALPYILQTC